MASFTYDARSTLINWRRFSSGGFQFKLLGYSQPVYQIDHSPLSPANFTRSVLSPSSIEFLVLLRKSLFRSLFLMQWSNVELEFKVRNQGESWTSVGGRTSSNSAVKLSESTWILEYHRSPLVQKSLLVPLVWEWMCFRAAQVVDELTRFQWLLPKPSSLSSATLASPPPT